VTRSGALDARPGQSLLSKSESGQDYITPRRYACSNFQQCARKSCQGWSRKSPAKRGTAATEERRLAMPVWLLVKFDDDTRMYRSDIYVVLQAGTKMWGITKLTSLTL